MSGSSKRIRALLRRTVVGLLLGIAVGLLSRVTEAANEPARKNGQGPA